MSDLVRERGGIFNFSYSQRTSQKSYPIEAKFKLPRENDNARDTQNKSHLRLKLVSRKGRVSQGGR